MTAKRARLLAAVLALIVVARQSRATLVVAAGAGGEHPGGGSGEHHDGGRLNTGDPHLVEPKIVGGIAARFGRYPYIVSLRIRNIHFCGGALIHSRLVLTAAHCFFEADGRRSSSAYWRPQLRIGGYSREGGGYEASRGVRTVVHPHYNSSSQENDVALVLLHRPSTKTPIRVPPGRPAAMAGTMLTAIGFGVLWDHGPAPRYLQEAPLMLLNYAACRSYMPNERWGRNSMLCAGQPSRHKDTCTGDSGGPLLHKDHRGRPWLDIIYGITSFGYKCAGSRPGTYTNVAMMAPWIRQTAWRLLAPLQRGRRLARGFLDAHQLNMTTL